MENINDVEFGSNKNKEEAPILVAQRYLNIFRQVHIFNKQKRDQFDDELLALPDNILEFFKRMPGGRLLIEHMEDVKTERGIAFVKSNKEDFTNSATDTSSTPTVSGGAPVVGGSLVMDSSFAETFASSMAKAFQQAPSSSGGVAVPANLGPAFNLIAEEIKSSRTSLLDVLRETRNITDSVIATQVSISRILEGLLSSDKSTNVDMQLAQFKREIDGSLSEMRQLLYNMNSSGALSRPQPQDFQKDTVKNEDEIDDNVFSEENRKKKKKKKKNNSVETPISDFSFNSAKNIINDDSLSEQDFSSQITDGVIRNTAYKHEDDFSNVHPEIPALDTETSFRNHEEKLSSDFPRSSDVDDILSGLDDIDLSLPKDSESAEDLLEENTTSHPDNLDSFENDDGLDFTLPKDASTTEPILDDKITSQPAGLDDFENDDGLDFVLPEGDDVADLTLDDVTTSQPVELGDFESDDGLDFALPKNSDKTKSILDNEAETESSSLDDFEASDGLDFTLPESDDIAAPVLDKALESESLSLDDFGGNDDSELTLPEDDSETVSLPEEEPEAESEALSLDDFGGNDDSELTLPEDDSETVSLSEEEPEAESESLSLDDLSGADEELTLSEDEENTSTDADVSAPTSKSTSSPSGSRYSAELDKIRAALTGDGIDLSSLDEPIALDEYSDDENVPSDTDFSPSSTDDLTTNSADTNDISDDDWEYEYVEDEDANDSETHSSGSENGDDNSTGDWEWEYVDENGNAVPAQSAENSDDNEEWEWEYVDEDEGASDNENKQQ